MAKFYRLLDDLHIPNRWHLGEPVTDKGHDPSKFTAGSSVSINAIPNINVDIPGIALDFTLTTRIVPIATSRLAEIFSNIAGETLQRIPANVGSREGYEILNATQLVQCLDERRSEYTKWTEKDDRPDLTGHYRMVTDLHIDASRVPRGLHIFRIAWWNVVLVVSSELMMAIRSSGALGPKFLPID